MPEICCVGSGVKYQTRAVVFTRNKHTTVSRRMEAAGSTPTKSFSRLSFIPKSKKSIFLLHGEYIDNTDKRRKPFDSGVKTQICINLDGIFALGSRNLRSGPILAASIHSLLCGRAQIGPNTVSHANAAAANLAATLISRLNNARRSDWLSESQEVGSNKILASSHRGSELSTVGAFPCLLYAFILLICMCLPAY